jgi:hypothetical protein
MTVFVPTTTVTVERDNGTPPATGTYVPGYGDSVENWTPVVTGAPAYLYEDEQRTWDPSAGRMTIREVTRFRGRPNLELLDRDRITDERTGDVYQVDTLTPSPSVVGVADVKAVLVRVTA